MNSKYSRACVFWGVVYLALNASPTVVTGCPRGCGNCNESDGYIGRTRLVQTFCLHNSWMTEIPANLPTNMGTLVFKSNSVKTIKATSFERFRYLKRLDLRNNKIEEIENGSFTNQWSLITLLLNNNYLTNLTAEIFTGLHALNTLDLRNNHIAWLPRGVFHKLKALATLYLHDNLIANISDDAFVSLDFIREIHLSGCRLKKLGAGTFGNLMSLKTIDLSSNMIEDIDSDAFSCTPLLETLHCNDNYLKEVPVSVLSKLRFLKDLDLSNNLLTYIRSQTFIHNTNLETLNFSFCKLGFLQEGAFDGLTSLRHVFLNRNPLHCDCRLKWLLGFLNKSKDIVKESGLTHCATPSYLSRRLLVNMTITDLKCNCTTCQQDAACNSPGGSCASCHQGDALESCNCSRPLTESHALCHHYDGQCLCNLSAVPTPNMWTCNFKITNKTCNKHASLKKKGQELRCVCNTGWQGDGVNHCSDIDECTQTKSHCKYLKMARCRNTLGSYSCYCPQGYQVKLNGGCIDINECLSDPCGEQSLCSNTEGSYACQCKEGYRNILNTCHPVPNKILLSVKVLNSTAVLISWSEIIENRDTITSIRILYFAVSGSLTAKWTRTREVYTPNATQALVGSLTPDTYYTIKLELNLIYNISITSDVEYFQTKEKRSAKEKSAGSDNSVVIVISSVVGSAVAIAIGLTLIAFCLKRKEKTSNEGTDGNKPYLEDLIEMRMINREGNLRENTKAFSSRMDTWEVPRDRLKVGEKIGEGQFGIVLRGNLTTGEGLIKVAIKTIKSVDRLDMKDFMKEMDMMKEIGQHPNVVSLLGVSSIGAPLYIITEYVDGGDLLEVLRSSRRTDDRYVNMTSTLNSRELLRIALDVSKGMSHIALKKLVHRDLAARNVLMTTDLVAKIADFGLARDIYCEGMYVKTGRGRLPIKWMAPDAIRDQTYTIKSDVWSFGVLLWEIVTLGGAPYSGIPVNILLEKLLYGYRMPKPEHCSGEVYSIMEDCWALDPSERPSFNELCEALSMFLGQEGHAYVNIRSVGAEDITGSCSSNEDITVF